MTTINDDIAKYHEYLTRLEKLAQDAPDLLEHGENGIYVQCDHIRVVICDSSKDNAYWLALARKYKDANWTRSDSGPSSWDGELGGVRLTILPNEIATKVPLFIVEAA